ncbi:MAG: HD domain-containing phosphohydrolase [Desulfuromonadales bacterium]
MSTSRPHKELYNSFLIDPYLRLIAKRYPFVDINEILSYAQIMPWEAADESHWLSQERINRFVKRAVELTGNPDLAREAGQYVFDMESKAFMRSYALSFTNPHMMFSKIGEITKQLVRSSTYTSRKLNDSSVEIIVNPQYGCKEEPFQCENRMGLWEATIKAFHYEIIRIDHPECMFNGGAHCRYVVKWSIPTTTLMRRWRNYSTILLSLINLLVVFTNPEMLLGTVPSSICIYLLLDRLAVGATLGETSESMRHLSESRNQLITQLDANYNNSMLTSEIGHAISLQNSIDKVIHKVIKILEKRLDFDRGMVLLANDTKTKLTYRAGFGHDSEQREILQQASFRLDNPASRGVFVEAFKNQIPFLVDDFESFEKRHSTHSVNLAKALGVKSFVCCPIICEGESLGVLAVDNLKTSRSLMQRDKSLLMGIAPVIGVAIRNAELLLAKDKEFRSTLQVLAASIDARDPLTAGHSEKVTEYSVGICDEMEFDLEFREGVRVAALLHDYGKIGIPDAILKKEGRLSQEEYAVIMTHSTQTRNILERINFAGKYQDVPIIAGAHHEKWNGSGYPDGLKTDDIPMGSRIIAVADFFEAITAKRHYREPMPVDVALDLVIAERGITFDPAVVDAFIRFYNHGIKSSSRGSEGGGGICKIRPKRLSIDSPVKVMEASRSLQGKVCDISQNGVYVTIPENLEEDTYVRIEVFLPGEKKPFTAAGRIAWSNNGDNRPKPFYPEGYGIELTNVEDQDDELLANYLEAHLPSRSMFH